MHTPSTFEILPSTAEDDGLDHRYTVTMALREGRLVCTHLAIDPVDGGPPVTSEAVRAAAVYPWIADVAEDFVFEPTGVDQDGTELFRQHKAPPHDFAEDGMTDETLDKFSQHYAFLMVSGQRPSGVFQREYGLPRPTTTRWVNAAKDRGILIEQHERLRGDG